VRPWWELQERGQELMLQAPLQELPAGISSSLTFDVRSWLRESLVYIEAHKFISSDLTELKHSLEWIDPEDPTDLGISVQRTQESAGLITQPRSTRTRECLPLAPGPRTAGHGESHQARLA
jgi:hypothetical protein